LKTAPKFHKRPTTASLRECKGRDNATYRCRVRLTRKGRRSPETAVLTTWWLELHSETGRSFSGLDQGRNHGWKVEGDQGLGHNTGALAPGQRSRWVLGEGGGRPLPLWGSGGITPRRFLKTQMLNPAFWWLLAAKFLAFWKLRPSSWGTNTLLVPQPKSWGTSLPRSLRLLRLC